MKTLFYINTHPIFNRFNSQLRDNLHDEGIRVKLTKSPKPNTYVLSVSDTDYKDGLRVLLDTRMRGGYNSLNQTYTEAQKRRNGRRGFL